MEIRIGKKDVLWSYGAQLFIFGSNILILPIILRKLTSQQLGIWYIFIALYSLVMLLDFGLLPTISRNMTYILSGAKKLKAIGIEEGELQKTVDVNLLFSFIKTVKKIYALISVILFVLLMGPGVWYIHTITKGTGLTVQSTYAWIIYSVSTVLNFYYYYYSAILQGRGKIKESNKAIVYSKIVYLIIILILVLLGYGLIGLAIGNLCSIILNRILFHYYFNDKEMKTLKKKFILNKKQTQQIRLFKTIWSNSYRLGLVSLGAFLILRMNTLIGAKYLSLSTIAEYGITLQILNIVQMFSQMYFTTHIPKFNSLRMKGDMHGVKQLFRKCLRIALGTYISFFLIFLLLGNIGLKLIGSKTTLLTWHAIALFGIIILLELNHSISASLITTKNEVPFVKPALISGILIVIASIVMFKFLHMGVYSILLPQFIVQLCYNNWKWPHEVAKEFKMSFIKLIF